MGRLERAVGALSRAFARLGGLMILVIAVIVSIDVLTRNVLGISILNSLELSVYLFAVAISFGMSYTALCGAHIRVDVLYARFPAPLRRAMDFLAFASLAALSIFLFVSTFGLVVENAEHGTRSNSVIAVPLAIPQAFWALGLFVFAVTASLLALRHATLLFRGDGAQADRVGRFDASDEVSEAVDDALVREG
ncbi:TRAP transporter small permease subunit [Jiella mangrovi]|uniref:TRAP transporter small permease protein n=1 Tax=Jiella mangrovi TaxID=2821407 RepID=A0ABS4BKZ8_9HYPH|nr:TRAP transporter small permease [Jiella mangrovi]MBP0617415.1 TRAP transporter small permease subunit [Jiella mangrovi]